MKHLKTFKSYEKTNEALRHDIKKYARNLLGIAAAPFVLAITNLSNARFTLDLLTKQLDLYYNFPVLITAFNDILQEGDVTDSEREDIEYRLSEIRKTIAKYPTIDSLKNLYTREAKYFNFKNRNYIINKINEYQPSRMTISTLCDEIRKTYKFPKRVFNLGNTGVTGIVTRASRHHNLPNQNPAYQGYDLPQNPIDQNWTNEFDR